MLHASWYENKDGSEGITSETLEISFADVEEPFDWFWMNSGGYESVWEVEDWTSGSSLIVVEDNECCDEKFKSV